MVLQLAKSAVTFGVKTVNAFKPEVAAAARWGAVAATALLFALAPWEPTNKTTLGKVSPAPFN